MPFRVNFLLARLMVSLTISFVSVASALEPYEVILNEVYFDEYTKDRGPNHFEAIELLVVKDGVDLNGLTVSDRDQWNVPAEFQCILQDSGQEFLKKVPSGTLVVIYSGTGEDDIDPKDFTLVFYAKSSLFCNLAGKTNAFYLGNYGDNVHVLQGDKQIDYLKFRPGDRPERGGSPGALEWELGDKGFIDTGKYGESTGMRYLGDKPELNDFLAAWQPYSETQIETNNLGKANSRRNNEWIEKLRAESKAGKSATK